VKSIIKWIYLAYIVVTLVMNKETGFVEVILVLLVTALNVFKHKYYDRRLITCIYTLVILAGAYFQKDIGILLCMSVYDFVYEEMYPAAAAAAIVLAYIFRNDEHVLLYVMLAGLSGLLGFVLSSASARTGKYKILLDNERRLRYELENTKNRLLSSIKETQRLAEVNERNRIAREIHDSAGHMIAGILIQLQALRKLGTGDPERFNSILDGSINALSEALTMLRDTVYRLKPNESLGVDYIRSIIDNFGYCPVDFMFIGDFSTLPTSQVELLAANIKEALTNISRHSDAGRVTINIDINEKFTRLYIKDDGKGCKVIHEGMGLSGMRERVANAGGTLSVDGSNGFTIICVLPAGSRGGEAV
jgi:signal transduction histidine kinase